jgi:hypothetical protein
MADTLAALKTLTAKARGQVDRNRRRAETLLATIERAKRRIAQGFYQVGTALNALAEPRHYGALGYASITALLADRKVLPRTTAFELMAIARSFTREQALALGSAKAVALVRYVEATPAEDVARVLVDSDAKIGNRPLSKLSVRDVLAATTALRTRARRRSADPAERAARKAARDMQTTLRKTVSRALTTELQRKDGRWWVRIEVPVEAIGKIGSPTKDGAA